MLYLREGHSRHLKQKLLRPVNHLRWPSLFACESIRIRNCCASSHSGARSVGVLGFVGNHFRHGACFTVTLLPTSNTRTQSICGSHSLTSTVCATERWTRHPRRTWRKLPIAFIDFASRRFERRSLLKEIRTQSLGGLKSIRL